MRVRNATCATLLILTTLSCAGSLRVRVPGTPGTPGIDPAEFGIYKVRAIDPDGESRRFRLRLFLELPDRIHAEVVPPVGGPHLILDSGGGRLAVTVVRDGVAFVGDYGSEVALGFLGVRVSANTLVRALLGGETPMGPPAIVMEPSPGQRLPGRFEMTAEGGTLLGELLRVRPVPADSLAALGTGAPPGQVQVRPLRELQERAGDYLRLFEERAP